LLSLFVLNASLWAGLGSDKAMYVGGTVSALKEKDEGKPLLEDKAFTFEQKHSKFSIPYEQINSIEYGQKAGRRIGMAVVVSPLFLFSHKRRHFLTIGYLDENKKQQAAVFELGKSAIKPTLSGLEAKTGKKVDYEDAEARKSGTGGN
jgi:hypothetical protein